MTQTQIPYCDATWDLTIGCRKRSAGCENCWATRTVHRLACQPHEDYTGQTTSDGRDWLATDQVNLLWNMIEAPAHWRKPRFVFVNSKSDLFDERVPFEFVGRAFDEMAFAHRHRFMVLTKEPQRMAAFVAWYRGGPTSLRHTWPDCHSNVILMVSVEGPGQMERIDALAEIPAARRGVSFEPLLEAMDIGRHLARYRSQVSGLRYTNPHAAGDHDVLPGVDWVVIGCEKLLGGRAGRWAGEDPLGWWRHTESMVTACRDADVPVWTKQGPLLGEREAGHATRVTHDRWDFPHACQVQQRPKGWQL